MFHLIILVFFFHLNRNEKSPRSKIESLLNDGVTIVCDSYSFSGVAFSGAKDGMNMEWLKGPEEGLPAPDRVIYLDIDVEVSLMFLFNIIWDLIILFLLLLHRFLLLLRLLFLLVADFGWQIRHYVGESCAEVLVAHL